MSNTFWNQLNNVPWYGTECCEDIQRLLKIKTVEILVTPVKKADMPAVPLSNRTTSLIEYEDGAIFIIRDAKTKIKIAEFVLCQLRGCCGVCMSTGEIVSSHYRNRGVGTILGKFRKAIAKDRGYTVLFCTHVATNQAQNKVLRKNRWLDVYRFRNRRTGNLVDFSVVSLDPAYEAHPLITQGEDTCLHLSIESPSWKFASSKPRTSWFSWLFMPF